jgi:hypothetical protein
MVIFDLICHNNHSFEGWFKDLTDLEDQLGAGRLACPVCGDNEISRLPSTFGIGRSRGSEDKAPKADAPAETQEPLDARKAELLLQLETLSDRLREDFVDVGPSFTTEALKMHYGASPKRNIRGLSTEREEELLKSEGIDFFKVPMLVRKSPAAS